jgi:hypothetical protein
VRLNAGNPPESRRIVRSDDQKDALKLSQNGPCAVNLNPVRTKAAWIAVAVATASLTACSGVLGSPSGGNAVPAGNASPAAGLYAGNSNSGDCLLGANSADVQVGIADPTSSCAQWIQNLAADGLVWYPLTAMVLPGNAGSADQETMQQACDLTDGTQELYIEDAGGQDYGDSICSQEEQNGWTPEGSPGPLASQAQQQAQQEAQAQASASAAASQASRDAAAQQQAQNDLSTLEGFSLSSDLGKLASDLSQTNNDLAAEKTAAAAGPNADGGDCYNLESNVNYDAQSDVEYDAQSDFGYDLQQNLVPDISSGRQDISALQSDLSNLQSLGLSTPSGAQAAITTAQNEISNAISTANSNVSQVNADVDAAWAVSNSTATGSCSGDGLGSPPSPVQGIN